MLTRWLSRVFRGLRPSSRGERRRSRRREPAVEALASRTVFSVSITLSTAGVLKISGDSWRNDVVVDLVNNGTQVKVFSSSVPQSGYSLTSNDVTKYFTKSNVKSIEFYGRGGDDEFVNNFSVETRAWGGSGNDYLEGADENDVLYGDSGNDTLRGYGANDRLYGGEGNDSLYGGEGVDGLYGGLGDDSLYGEGGADRFLVYAGSGEQKDASGIDALMIFENGNKNWKQSEIEKMDIGFSVLARRSLSDNLLEDYYGGSTTFIRNAASTKKSSILATNFGNGRIEFYNGAFNSTERLALTVVHEMGHNWDNEHSGWQSWLNLSGWRNTAPSSSQASLYKKADDGTNWWYLKSASFTRSYGHNNPYDDFATSWEQYFRQHYSVTLRTSQTNPLNNVALSTAKHDHLDAFFDTV